MTPKIMNRLCLSGFMVIFSGMLKNASVLSLAVSSYLIFLDANVPKYTRKKSKNKTKLNSMSKNECQSRDFNAVKNLEEA